MSYFTSTGELKRISSDSDDDILPDTENSLNIDIMSLNTDDTTTDPYFNISLRDEQYDEPTLIKYRDFYDAMTCLQTQKNLSPYFCFRYLYDSKEHHNDSDQWVSYDDIINYFSNKYNNILLLMELEKAESDKRNYL